MKTYRSVSQLCISAFALFSVLLNVARAVPGPDPHANSAGRVLRGDERRFPVMPVDVFRTEKGEYQQVNWDSDAFTALVFVRNPASSIPQEVFVVDDILRGVDDESSEGIFVTDLAGRDEGTLYRLAPKKKKTKKQQQREYGQEDVDYRVVTERDFDMSTKRLSLRRSFVGILWTRRAKKAFGELLREMAPPGTGGAGTARQDANTNGEEEENLTDEGGGSGGENLVLGDDKISWAYSVATGGVREGFIDPGQEYNVYRDPTQALFY